MSASKAVGSIGAISIRSYPASAVEAIACRASSGVQPPVQTSAWTPWVTVMVFSSGFSGHGSAVGPDAGRSGSASAVVEPAPAAQLGEQPLVAVLEQVGLGGVGLDHLGRVHQPGRGLLQRRAGRGGG